MAIKKVWIEEDCTACNLCVDTCPEVFELPDDIAVVIKGLTIVNTKMKSKRQPRAVRLK